MKNEFIGAIVIIAILAAIVVPTTVVLRNHPDKPKPAEIEMWYQREIIAQGWLMSATPINTSSPLNPNWLISLELMNANKEYETRVYYVPYNLETSAVVRTEGRPAEVQEFKIGQYYVLYRKQHDGIRYYLSEWKDSGGGL